MKLRTFLPSILIAPILIAGATGASAQESLTVTSWGGAYQKAQQKTFFEPFNKATGIKVREDEWDGSVAKIKAMVETKQVTWDVVSVLSDNVLQGCEEGWLEKIDYSKLGGKDQFVEGSAMECGVGTDIYATIFAYNKDKFPKGGPSTMADLFDAKKFPGPRAFYKSPKTTLEFALIADGVPAKDVYKVLATKAGVDRAFKKLDTIKPHVKVWWSAGAQPPQLLADGEVVMTVAWNGRIQDAIKANRKPFQIVWDGQAMDVEYFAIPKGAKNLDAAKKFLAFAMKPEVLARQTDYISYGPTVKAALAHVKPEVLAELPNAPQNAKNAFVLSPQFWADHEQELTERFNKWLAQ